jgi:hypothetical protein
MGYKNRPRMNANSADKARITKILQEGTERTEYVSFRRRLGPPEAEGIWVLLWLARRGESVLKTEVTDLSHRIRASRFLRGGHYQYCWPLGMPNRPPWPPGKNLRAIRPIRGYDSLSKARWCFPQVYGRSSHAVSGHQVTLAARRRTAYKRIRRISEENSCCLADASGS